MSTGPGPGFVPVTLRLTWPLTVDGGPFLSDVPLEMETVAVHDQQATVVLVGTREQLEAVADGIMQTLAAGD